MHNKKQLNASQQKKKSFKSWIERLWKCELTNKIKGKKMQSKMRKSLQIKYIIDSKSKQRK